MVQKLCVALKVKIFIFCFFTQTQKYVPKYQVEGGHPDIENRFILSFKDYCQNENQN